MAAKGHTNPINTSNPCDPTKDNEENSCNSGNHSSGSGCEVAQPDTPHQNRCRNKKNKHWLDYAVFVAAILAAIGGIGAAGFTWWQASIARDQLEVAQDTAKRQLRAYVHVQSAKPKDICDGCFPTAAITLKNSGQTPAYDWQAGQAIGLFDKDHKVPWPDFDFTTGTRGILAPGQTSDFEVTNHKIVLTRESLQALSDGSLTLFVIGHVRYRDAFGIQRNTKYRYRYGGPVGMTMGQDQEGNEAD